MSRINKQNYEVFFMDYFDGNLSEESKQDLFAFLQQHPDLQDEFEGFEEVKLTAPASKKYPAKETLKKQDAATVGQINAFNFEDFFIARREGDLSQEEAKNVDGFLQKNPHLRPQAKIYESLRFIPDRNTAYPDKENLKKQVTPFLIRRKKAAFLAVAASVLLLVGLFIFRNEKPHRIQPVNTIAYITEKAISYPSSSETPVYRNTTTGLPRMIEPEKRTLQPVHRLVSLSDSKQLPGNSTEIAMNKRLEQTSNYHYFTIMNDLEYYVALQEYQKKSPLGKMFYQVENRLTASEMYIAEPILSPVRFDRESFSSLNNFSFSQLLDMMPEHGRFRANDF